MRLLYKLNYQRYNAMHTERIKRIKITTKLITFDLGLVDVFLGVVVDYVIVVFLFVFADHTVLSCGQ